MAARGDEVSGKAPAWAAVGTVAFIALVPGTVIGLVPYLLSRWTLGPPLLGWEGTRWLGVLLLVTCAPVFAAFHLRFVVEGHGTPAPIAPPSHLVVGGPFRWVRNPGYVAGIGLVVGQGLLFGSGAVLTYALALWAGFHAFVVLYEEPALRRRFGAEYEEYRREVPRWIPRRRPIPRR